MPKPKEVVEETISDEEDIQKLWDSVPEDGKEIIPKTSDAGIDRVEETDEKPISETKTEEKDVIKEELSEKEDIGDKKTDEEREQEVQFLLDNTTDKKLKQHYKSLQGMYKSEIERKKKLEQEYTDLKSKADVVGKGEEGEPTINKPKSEEGGNGKADPYDQFAEQIKSLPEVVAGTDELGEQFADAIVSVAKNLVMAMDNRLSQIYNAFKPIADSYVKTEDERHINAIAAVHKDYEKYVDNGEILNWIKEHPKYKQKAYLDVYENGETSDVIDLITDFKKAKGYTSSPDITKEDKKQKEEELQAQKEKELREMETITGKKTPISIKGKPIQSADVQEIWDSLP